MISLIVKFNVAVVSKSIVKSFFYFLAVYMWLFQTIFRLPIFFHIGKETEKIEMQ